MKSWKFIPLIFLAILFSPLRSVSGDRVPAPFEPLRVRSLDDGKILVGLWGRTYLFSGSPLPQAIVSQKSILWDREPVFKIKVSGNWKRIHWNTIQLVSQSADEVRFKSEAIVDGIQVQFLTSIEYDGMIKADGRISSETKVKIEGYSYEIETPEEIARYFNFHVPYDYRNLRVDYGALRGSAGFFPKESTSYGYTPSFYIGNQEVGFEWWSQSNASWDMRTGEKPILLSEEEGRAKFKVIPIQHGLELEPDKQWKDQIIVFAMPLRPPRDDWRSIRFIAPDRDRFAFDAHVRAKYYWIAFPKQFDAKWHGLPEANPTKRQRGIRYRLKKNRVGYIPYGKLTVVPSMHPVAMENIKEWSATGQYFTYPTHEERRYLKTTYGWKEGEPYGYAACIGREDYLDWMYQENMKTFVEEGLDGIYFDFGQIHQMCEKSPSVRDGNDEVWEYLNLRDFYRKLYTSMKNHDPNSVLAIHTPGQPKALAGFVDIIFIGEGFNIPFRQGRKFSEIKKDRSLYKADYLSLPEGLLDALIFPRAGGVVTLLPQVHHGIDPKNLKKSVRSQRELHSLMLVNDSPIWFVNSEMSTLHKVYRAIDQFGNLDDADFVPWWDESNGIKVKTGLKASAYLKDRGALVIVSNRSEEIVHSKVQFDFSSYGVREIKRARNPERFFGKIKVHDGDTIHLSVPARNFRLIILDW